MKALRIFVIADTHNKLPQGLATLSEGADEIWHLGDVTSPTILLEIEKFGPPVTIVRGNCDSNIDWPISVDLTRNGKKFRLIHIPPDKPPSDVDIVLHGHTHVPRNERLGGGPSRTGTLFLNPGCVTRPNRGAPPSVAYLEISPEGELEWDLRRVTSHQK